MQKEGVKANIKSQDIIKQLLQIDDRGETPRAVVPKEPDGRSEAPNSSPSPIEVQSPTREEQGGMSTPLSQGVIVANTSIEQYSKQTMNSPS